MTQEKAGHHHSHPQPTLHVGKREPLFPLLRSRRGSFRQLKTPEKPSNDAGLRQLASWQHCQLPTEPNRSEMPVLSGFSVGRALPTAGSWQSGGCSWQRFCQQMNGQSWGLRIVQIVVVHPHLRVFDRHGRAREWALVMGGKHALLAHGHLPGFVIRLAIWCAQQHVLDTEVAKLGAATGRQAVVRRIAEILDVALGRQG